MTLRSAAAGLAWILLLALAPLCRAEVLQGRVVGVTDGDTITVLDGQNTRHKIRLAGIDAPERGQPFGTASKQALADLVFDRQVTVEYTKRDRYRRIVGKVLVDGRDAGLEQIRAGLAWHYKKYEREQGSAERHAYGEVEEQANVSGKGLWKDGRAIAPWSFRATSP